MMQYSPLLPLDVPSLRVYLKKEQICIGACFPDYATGVRTQRFP